MLATKAGKHGTLYLYRITWISGDPCEAPTPEYVYAYDRDGAIEKWTESNLDQGYDERGWQSCQRWSDEHAARARHGKAE